MNHTTDQLETMILMALDAHHTDNAPSPVVRTKSTGASGVFVDAGKLLQFDAMQPRSAFAMDMSDDNRIYATNQDLLLTHPAEILGSEAEVIMLNGDILKWYGVRSIKHAPKGVSCLGIPSHWYEMHVRFVDASGNGEYYKRAVPFNKKGAPLPAKAQGKLICAPRVEGEYLIIMASIIEDAHRKQTMLASVKERTEIKFPVPLGDYRKVFIEREGPLSGTRRKAILHWVAKHLRRSTTGVVHNVGTHTRGVQEFVIDGMTIRLAPN